jgi:hypothetical protein
MTMGTSAFSTFAAVGNREDTDVPIVIGAISF